MKRENIRVEKVYFLKKSLFRKFNYYWFVFFLIKKQLFLNSRQVEYTGSHLSLLFNDIDTKGCNIYYLLHREKKT